jgi:hypothetical protein
MDLSITNKFQNRRNLAEHIKGDNLNNDFTEDDDDELLVLDTPIIKTGGMSIKPSKFLKF